VAPRLSAKDLWLPERGMHMIELPEAVTIARQITKELKGKRIESGIRGNAPHKFAFYSRPAEEYEQILVDKTIGEARDWGSQILISVEPGHVLVLGGGGERIYLHGDETTLPKKHQLLLRFTDGSYLSVTVQGWGSAQLFRSDEVSRNPHLAGDRPSPLSSEFTLAYLRGLSAQVPPEDPRSVKYFIISQPGVLGIGNGYLQDILFRARLHPRRRVVSMTAKERAALHRAITSTVKRAVKLGGRDSERDLYDQPGRYVAVLDKRAKGNPCPECGTAIEKIAYLGGACYFCPTCQT
jgi:formamidopyrimidine-DNA glycosylase